MTNFETSTEVDTEVGCNTMGFASPNLQEPASPEPASPESPRAGPASPESPSAEVKKKKKIKIRGYKDFVNQVEEGKKTDPEARGRGFILTINQPDEEDEEKLKKDKYQYLVYQYEMGDKTQKLHIQAFIYYHNALKWKTVKKRYQNAHIENSKHIRKCVNYCKKEKTRVEGRGPYEFGTMPEAGRRTDLETVAEEIKDGKKMSEIAEDNPEVFVRHFKGLKELKETFIKDRDKKPEVMWAFGVAGVGKTRWPYQTYPGKSIYIKDGTLWWNGYEQQDIILIDDFDGGWPYRDFLRLLDRYPYQGQFKGGYTKVNSPIIVITCEFPPEHFWGPEAIKKEGKEDNREQNKLDQVLRRLDEVRELERTELNKLVLPKRTKQKGDVVTVVKESKIKFED